MSPAEYGNYAIVLATVSIVSSFAITWISQANVRLYEKFNNSKERDSYIATNIIFFLAVNIFISLCWLIVVTFFFNNLPKSFLKLLQLGTVYLFFESAFSFTTGFLRAERNSKKYMIENLIKSIGTITSALLIIYFFDFGAEIILIVSSFFSFIFFIILLVDTKIIWKNIAKMYSRKITVNSFKYGIPLSLSALSSYGLSLSDRYFLQFYLGSEVVGIYSAGYRLAEMSIMMLAGLGVFSAFPVIINIYEKKGAVKAQELIRKLSDLYIIILSPVLLIIFLFPKEIINLFLGDAYSSSYIILPVVSGGAFFWGLSQYINKGFELKEKTNYLLYLLLSSSILTIALNFILIPAMGMMGAAYATLIGYIVYAISSFYFSKDLLRWNVSVSSLLKSCASILISYIFIKLLPIRTDNNLLILILNSSAILVTYSLSMIFMKEKNITTYLSILQPGFKRAQ